MTPRTLLRKYRLLIFVGTLIVCCVFIVFFSGTLFRIREINMSGDDVAIDVDQKQLNTNLLFFPTMKLEKELLSRYPMLGSVSVRKKFPHTLIIEVTVRKAIARLPSDLGFVALSSGGTVVSDARTQPMLPLIDVPFSSVQIGQSIQEPRILTALSYIQADMTPSLRIERVSFYDDSSLLIQTAETNIIVPQQSDTRDTIATLQQLVTRFRMKGRLPAQIDLRFDKPIIKEY